MKRKFRIRPDLCHTWAFERFDGTSTGNVEIWRVLNIFDSKETAEKALAKAESKAVR
jgi:hypothetical protein